MEALVPGRASKGDGRDGAMGVMYSLPPGLKEAQAKNKAKAQEAKNKADLETEKFALLKDAPRMGEYTKEIDVVHKPFGVLLNNAKCKRCGGNQPQHQPSQAAPTYMWLLLLS